jgi:hypothetical protein
MIDTKDLIDLKTRIIKYIKHIIKTGSTITDDEIKKYFIFWLYLTDLTDQNITIEDSNFNNNENEDELNELNKRIKKNNTIYKDNIIQESLTSSNNKSDYFIIKFYLDCGLYNISIDWVDYFSKSNIWYNDFVGRKGNELKINIAPPSAPLSSSSGIQNVHQYSMTQNRSIINNNPVLPPVTGVTASNNKLSDNIIKIMSINLLNSPPSQNWLSVQQRFHYIINEHIKTKLPDLICLQESNKDLKIDKYTNIANNANNANNVIDSDTDHINVFLRNDGNWEFEKFILLDFNCPTNRGNLLITLINKTTKLLFTIAVCHLCGGRYDEIHINTNDNILDIYNKPLNEIIARSPNIILGDFNLDYEFYVNSKKKDNKKTFLIQKTKDYLINDLKLTDFNKYIQLNNQMFNYLETNNYKNICEDECFNNYYKTYHTTPFDTSVDVLYYKNKGSVQISKNKFEIIKLFQNDQKYPFLIPEKSYTDHNGIYAELQIQ